MFVGLEQALGDEEVLPHAQRTECHPALEDFARARINHGRPVGPAARRAMYPLDDVVAHVHRVGVRGQQLDLEGVLVACRRERLVPPRRAFQQRRADRLRRAGIEVVDDGFHGLAACGRRVLLVKAVPGDKTFDERFLDRGGIVRVLDRVVAAAWIKDARLVAGSVGQFDEGLVLTHRHGRRIRCHRLDPLAFRLAGEGQRRLKLGVLREALGSGQVQGATRIVELVSSLLLLGQGVDDTVRVVEQKRHGVDEHAPVFLRLHLEAPQHRLREGLLQGGALVGVGADGAVAQVLLDQEHLRSHANKAHHVAAAQLPTVQADVVGADARRQ